MKKVLLALLTVGALVKVGLADDQQPVPKTGAGESIFWSDYGGYKISTAAFGAGAAAGAGVNYTTAAYSGPGVLAEVYYSTGNAFDNNFVEVWDSTSATFANNSTLIGRFYNSGQFYVAGSSQTAGASGPFKPRQFERGLLYRCSSAVYNLITVSFYTR